MFNLRIRVSRATLLFFGAILIAVTLLAGCKRVKDYTDVEHVQRAKEFQDKNNFSAAVIELKNALQKNSKNAEARWLIGEIYANVGLGKEAEKELKLAKEFGVNQESLKVPMGLALLQQREYERVLKEIEPGQNSSKVNVARILVIRGEAQLGLSHESEGCALFAQALEVDSAYIPAHLGGARCEAMKGRFDVAKSQIENALKLEPKNARAWTALGDLHNARGQYGEADKAYTTTLQFHPGFKDALAGRAASRIRLKQFTEASQDLDALLKVNKDLPYGIFLRGILQFQQAKYADAKTSFENVLKVSADHAPSILWLGLTAYAQQNYEQAVAHLTSYVRSYPNAVQVKAILASSQARMGNKEGARDTLQQLHDVKLEDPQSLVTIGQTYLLVGDNSLATQYLGKAVEQQPDEGATRVNLATALLSKGDSRGAIDQLERAIKLDPKSVEADTLLIQTYVREKKYEEARKATEELERKYPKTALPHTLRGAILVLQNKIDVANAEFLKALELEPGNPAAAYNLAGIAMDRGDWDEARKYYQSVLDRYADHLPTLIAQYALEVAAKRPQEALKILERAVEKHPKNAGPASLLAWHYVNAGNHYKALEVTRDPLAAHPDDPDLLNVRGAAYLAMGDAENALVAYKRLAKLQPNSADAQYGLSRAYGAANNVSEARKALLKTLELGPKHFGARVALAQLELLQGKLDQAMTHVRQLRKDYPNAMDAPLIESQVLVKQKKVSEAIKLLNETQKAHSDSERPVLVLAGVQWDSGDKEGSLTTSREWFASHPTNVPVSIHLGDAYLTLGREKEATEIYEKALKVAPNHAGLLNNVAWLYRKTNPTKALQYAEKAYAAKPDDPGIADTLGWLLVEQGKLTRGLDLLKKANQLAPNAVRIHYHLAVALAKNGEKAQARRELDRLLTSRRPFPELEEARLLQRQL